MNLYVNVSFEVLTGNNCLESEFDIFAGEAQAAPILASARDLLGADPHALPDAARYENRAGQILCVARALAAAACLAPAAGCVVAGYSVGEVAAWGVAGFWSFEQTLRLTALRAELMDAAGGDAGGLGFVRGLERGHVEALAAQFDCALAIVNPRQSFVIGGPRDRVEQCCAAALAQGAAAARRIGVNVASHTPLLAGAVAPFRAVLQATPLSRPMPGRVLVGAATASVVAGAPGLAGLAAQIGTTLDWAAVLDSLIERGVDRVLELGPGSALAEMAHTAYPALDVRALDDFRSLAGAAAWMRRDAG